MKEASFEVSFRIHCGCKTDLACDRFGFDAGLGHFTDFGRELLCGNIKAGFSK